MTPSRPVFLFQSLNKLPPRRHLRAIPMKQSCYPFSKIYYVLKFQPSRWTLAPKKPIFPFLLLNKLGPLVAYPKIVISVPGHIGQDQSTLVSSQSINIQDHFSCANCEPRITIYARVYKSITLYARQR